MNLPLLFQHIVLYRVFIYLSYAYTHSHKLNKEPDNQNQNHKITIVQITRDLTCHNHELVCWESMALLYLFLLQWNTWWEVRIEKYIFLLKGRNCDSYWSILMQVNFSLKSYKCRVLTVPWILNRWRNNKIWHFKDSNRYFICITYDHIQGGEVPFL